MSNAPRINTVPALALEEVRWRRKRRRRRKRTAQRSSRKERKKSVEHQSLPVSRLAVWAGAGEWAQARVPRAAGVPWPARFAEGRGAATGEKGDGRGRGGGSAGTPRGDVPAFR